MSDETDIRTQNGPNNTNKRLKIAESPEVRAGRPFFATMDVARRQLLREKPKRDKTRATLDTHVVVGCGSAGFRVRISRGCTIACEKPRSRINKTGSGKAHDVKAQAPDEH